jgi:hypothetical protein
MDEMGFGLQYDVPWPCANDGNFVDGPFKLVSVRVGLECHRNLSILGRAGSDGGEKCEDENYPNHDEFKLEKQATI